MIIKSSHLSNHHVDAVTQYSQVINGTKVLQQKSVDCIEDILYVPLVHPRTNTAL